MSEVEAKTAPATKPLRPKDAATLIVVDEQGPSPRILMGRRRADLVFMPNKFVFPGGRVDQLDAAVPAVSELAPSEHLKLMAEMKGHPSDGRARALAIAAVREAYEETGILIGGGWDGAADRLPADLVDTWGGFFAAGQAPNLAALSLFARAITPPGRPRRYDTRFFTVAAAAISLKTDKIDEELSEIDWFAIDEARALDLPSITRAIIEDLAERLRHEPETRAALPVPFYFFRAGTFCRDLITAG
jgi:8-oxo-dGTP pyrophosphatase MutT (NUDIX family)